MRKWIAAGAGSGKTESLVGEILAALEAGIPPGEILALTFTRAAAAELKLRVRIRLHALAARGSQPVDLDALTVTTFHAFAGAFLGEEFVRAGWGLSVTILDETEGAAVETDRLHEFVTGDAAARPTRWEKLLALSGLGGAIEIAAMIADAAGARPGEFRALLGQLDPAARAGARAGAARDALAGLRETAPELTAVTSDFKRFPDCVIGQLEAVADGAWPAEPQRTAALRILEKLDAKGFPARKAGAIKKAVISAYRVLQGILFETAIEPTLPAIWDYLTTRREAVIAGGGLGFDDLIRLTAERLEEPATARRLAERYRCLLVDEAQDTDPVQARLISALHEALGGQGRIIIVGDEKQAIYRFRCADLLSYRALFHTLGDPAVESQTVNFRSRSEILDFIHAYGDWGGFEPMGDDAVPLDPPFWSATAKLLPRDGAIAREPRVLLLECSPGALLDWAARWLPEHDFDWSDGLFLADANKKLDELEHGCLRRDIPVVRTGNGLWAREIPLALLNAAEAAADPENDLALLATLRSPLFAVSDTELLAALSSSSEMHGFAPGLRRRLNELPPALSSALNLLNRLHEDPAPVADRFRRLVDTSGLGAALHQEDFPGASAEREALALALRLAAGTSGLRDFAERLRLKKESEARMAMMPDPSRPGAKLLTIHGAKGLGEKVVFLDLRFDFGEQRRDRFRFDSRYWGYFHGERNVGTPGWNTHYEKEETTLSSRDRAALAYVGMTRAKEWLILWAPKLPEGESPNRLSNRISKFLQWEKGPSERTLPKSLAHAASVEPVARTEERVPSPIVVPAAVFTVTAAPGGSESLPTSFAAAEKRAKAFSIGSLVHKTFERWSDFRPESLSHAVGLAAQETGASAEDAVAVLELIKLRLSSPRLAEFQDALSRNALWREYPLFFPDGVGEPPDEGASSGNEEVEESFWQRGVADLIYRDTQNGWNIIDYKTGKPDEEKRKNYKKQLAEYRAALNLAGIANARMFLWYIEMSDMPEELT